jgi:hypothetical protein
LRRTRRRRFSSRPDLERVGIPVNFTSTFSPRQVVVTGCSP